MKTLNVFYRVCDKVNHTNGLRELGSKKDILKGCFASLVNSTKYFISQNGSNAIFVNVVFDNTTDETINMVRETFQNEKIPHRILFSSNGGNVDSFKTCYIAAKEVSGYIFFLEDDYLLDIECFDEMYAFLNLWSDDSHICLKPHGEAADYIRDLFGGEKENKYFQREVLLSKGKYWARIMKSTCTFLIDDFILKDVENLFEKTVSRQRLDETYLNQIYKRYPLFSPIPPMADHFHTIESLRPYFQGRKLNFRQKYSVENLKNETAL